MTRANNQQVEKDIGLEFIKQVELITLYENEMSREEKTITIQFQNGDVIILDELLKVPFQSYLNLLSIFMPIKHFCMAKIRSDSKKHRFVLYLHNYDLEDNATYIPIVQSTKKEHTLNIRKFTKNAKGLYYWSVKDVQDYLMKK